MHGQQHIKKENNCLENLCKQFSCTHFYPVYNYVRDAYLHNKWSVFNTGNQGIFAVFWISDEHRAVEHGGVTKLSTMASAQKSPRQFTGIYHRSNQVAW